MYISKIFQKKIISSFKLLIFLVLLWPLSSIALIDMKNANFVYNQIDFELKGTGYNLKIEASYNSRSIFSGILGYGWCTEMETSLKITPEGNIHITECGAGNQIVYTPKKFSENNINKTIKKIIAALKKKEKKNADYYKTLVQRLRDNDEFRINMTQSLGIKTPSVSNKKIYYANGKEIETIIYEKGYYTRKLTNNTSQRFDQNGHLTHIYDTSGNYILFKYKGDLISQIIDNNNRILQLFYNKNKKVILIKGPYNLKVSYKYNVEDRIYVKNTWNNVYTYQYDDLHNLTKINFPNKKSQEITYNKAKDWVTSFKDVENCLETYGYFTDSKNPLNHFWSTVKKVCGKKIVNKSRYEFWHKKNKAGITYLHRVYSDFNGKKTDVIYHPTYGKPIVLVLNGEKTRFEYYDNAQVKIKYSGNERIYFKYDPKTNQPSQIYVQYLNKKGKVINKKTSYFKYNGKGKISFAKNSDGQYVHLYYDDNGLISSLKDQSKKKLLIEYDKKSGKPQIITRPGFGSVKLTYKNDGSINKIIPLNNKNKKDESDIVIATQISSSFNNLLDIIEPAMTNVYL